jgi:hypothetical protein
MNHPAADVTRCHKIYYHQRPVIPAMYRAFSGTARGLLAANYRRNEPIKHSRAVLGIHGRMRDIEDDSLRVF